MSFDPWYMLVALVASGIGMGAFMYGKKQADGKFLFLGGVIFAVTYFITDPLYLALVTAVLTALLFSDPIVNALAARRPPKEIEEIPPKKR